MNVKTLKKQLMAAIAMVCVAAIALGSSTYAWFVSNNSVKATTTSISAQSNSAYLVIQNDAKRTVNGQADVTGTNIDSTSAATAADTSVIELYPAQVVNGSAAGSYKFESAYASAANDELEKYDTRFTIGTNGTAAEAVTTKYAHKDTFYIGTGTYDGEFSNLKVTGVSISATDSSKAALVDATRVLIVCGDQWCVWKNGSEVTSVTGITGTAESVTAQNNTLTPKYTDDTNKAIAASVSKDHDVTVDVYVFYDGAADTVYSDNLANLKDCGVTITFEATPTEHKA